MSEDHDQRGKNLIKEMPSECVELLANDWHKLFNFDSIDWKQQEIFVDPPTGERKSVDLIAAIQRVGEEQSIREVMLHFELESGDSLTSLRARMPGYRFLLKRTHGSKPLLSFAIYLGVGLQGLGWDTVTEQFEGELLSEIRWCYLGLPGLDAWKYVEGENLLGVAFSVLMKCKPQDKPRLKARALQRIGEAELTPYRRYLLMEFVEAYLPLDGSLMTQYQELLLTKEFEMALKIGQTSFEKGVEKGQREMMLELLREKFDTLPEEASKRVEGMSAQELKQLARSLMKANSLVDLGLAERPSTSS
jgi:hypothetical protein